MIQRRKQRRKQNANQAKRENTQNKTTLKLSDIPHSIDFVQVWNWAKAKIAFFQPLS